MGEEALQRKMQMHLLERYVVTALMLCRFKLLPWFLRHDLESLPMIFNWSKRCGSWAWNKKQFQFEFSFK
jgi:hypothetical protein